jgi:hypothetical protein
MSFLPADKRYRLFFDETGNGDLEAAAKNPNERYLSLTGIVIRQDHHDSYLTRRLNHLKRTLFQDDNCVLHRRDIMRKEGVFAVLRSEDIRREFDARLASIVAECLTVGFTVSIDKLEHKQKYVVWQHNPYHYLLECLLERYVLWLKRNNYQGDMVGEARNSTHDAPLKRAFRYFYLHKTGSLVNASIIQSRLTSKELRLKPKTSNVAGLQIADMLAHPCHRSLKFEQLGETIPPDYGTFLVSIMRRQIYDRHPVSGKIETYGTKWLP